MLLTTLQVLYLTSVGRHITNRLANADSDPPLLLLPVHDYENDPTVGLIPHAVIVVVMEVDDAVVVIL